MKTLRVHVPNNEVLGFWVVVIIVQVLGKYMIIEYLHPQGEGCSGQLALNDVVRLARMDSADSNKKGDNVFFLLVLGRE